MALNLVESDAAQVDGTALFSRLTISGVHTFTYDAADNLITKTTPCTDDFDDGNFNGWFVWDGSWAVTNKVLQQTGASGGSLMMDNWSDANNEIRFSYRNTNTAANEKSAAIFRFNNGTFNRSHLSLYPSSALIQENIGGTFYTRASAAISTVQGQWYDVRIVADGGSVKVWRGPRGGNMDLIFNATGVLSVSTTDLCSLYAGGTSYQFDDFQGIGGGVANTTTTYGYDAGNKLTSMTAMGVTTSNAYDAWGRLTTSARGGVTARNAWRYGSKLYSVDSNNDGTAEVMYKTGGDGKRRARIAGASETWYNWSPGLTVVSEEAGSSGTGALTRTYVGRSLAHVDGANPATGTWRYMYHDHLGSVRQVRDANRNLVAEYAFLPYGQMDAWSGTANATTRLFTGHDRDPLTNQDYAPYRWYSSTMNRWLSRDPAGMVDGPNVYAYVGGNPINEADFLGLWSWDDDWIQGGVGGLLGFYGGDVATSWMDVEKGGYAVLDAGLKVVTMNGLWKLFNPQLFEKHHIGCDSSVALGELGFSVGLIAFGLPQGGAKGGMQAVTHWGPKGKLTGLRPGDWVMTGEPNLRNWIMAGMKYNPLCNINPTVPSSTLRYPSGVLGPIQGMIGQRRYCP